MVRGKAASARAGRHLAFALTLGALTTPAIADGSAEDAAMRERIDRLEQRIRELEARLATQARSGSMPVLRDEPVTPGTPAADPPTELPGSTEPAELAGAMSGGERPVPADPEPTAPRIDLGGALRYNLVHRDFVDASSGKRGESGFDLFRLNVDGEMNGIIVSAEYRHYSFMDTLRYGWLGYRFDDDSELQVGIHQVPFGLTPYASHNAWFGVPYYVGLADDYDMGIQYRREDGPWSTQLAFYKNEELNDSTDAGRYSLDLLRSGDQQNEEINQFNARVDYTFGRGSGCETEVGGSAQRSELYNDTTDQRGDHRTAAIHLDSRCGRWNLQLQGVRYEYDPANPVGVSSNTVRVGAFEGSYEIASEADILVANVAYNFPSPAPFIDQLTCYNDYSRLLKRIDDSRDSEINTIGCAIGSGPLFTYVDYILARDMAFFGNGSMGTGGDGEWRGRFNVNIGFYW